MGSHSCDDSRIYNVYEGMEWLMYKGIALDGVHVGTTTGISIEQSYGDAPRFTVSFVLDDRGVENLIDYLKMMEVMR